MERAVENVNPAKHDYTRISENKKEYRRVKTNERCLCFLSNVIVLNRRRGGKKCIVEKKTNKIIAPPCRYNFARPPALLIISTINKFTGVDDLRGNSQSCKSSASKISKLSEIRSKYSTTFHPFIVEKHPIAKRTYIQCLFENENYLLQTITIAPLILQDSKRALSWSRTIFILSLESAVNRRIWRKEIS